MCSSDLGAPGLADGAGPAGLAVALVARLPRQPGQKEVRYYHLFSGAAQPAAPAGAAQPATGVVIPLYNYPDPTWTAIAQARATYPGVPVVAIINPNNGPGASAALPGNGQMKPLRERKSGWTARKAVRIVMAGVLSVGRGSLPASGRGVKG